MPQSSTHAKAPIINGSPILSSSPLDKDLFFVGNCSNDTEFALQIETGHRLTLFTYFFFLFNAEIFDFSALILRYYTVYILSALSFKWSVRFTTPFYILLERDRKKSEATKNFVNSVSLLDCARWDFPGKSFLCTWQDYRITFLTLKCPTIRKSPFFIPSSLFLSRL